jgi:hypothetical protein
MWIDFIEVGTSDFCTLLESCPSHQSGISVDAVREYLLKLPSKANCQKLNLAITDYERRLDAYYIKPERIEELGLPYWLRGCNSVGAPHPTAKALVEQSGLAYGDVVTISSVTGISLAALVSMFMLKGIGELKIDTEGHDLVILNAYLDDHALSCSPLPFQLSFESNSLVDAKNVDALVKRLQGKNYSLFSRDHDVTMKRVLPLLSTSDSHGNLQRSGFGWYVPFYPENYDPSSMPHDNTLQAAFNWGKAHGCRAVTYQGGAYTARIGMFLERTIENFHADVISYFS